VRAHTTGIDLYRYHMRLAVTEDLEIGQQPRRDRVGDEAGNTFFERQRLGDATHMPRAILDADEHCAAGRIGERDDCAHSIENSKRSACLSLVFRLYSNSKCKPLYNAAADTMNSGNYHASNYISQLFLSASIARHWRRN
jgi:hypothetical protein